MSKLLDGLLKDAIASGVIIALDGSEVIVDNLPNLPSKQMRVFLHRIRDIKPELVDYLKAESERAMAFKRAFLTQTPEP